MYKEIDKKRDHLYLWYNTHRFCCFWGRKMKKVLFIILLLILGGCANVNETGKKETSKSDTVITEDKKLKFVRIGYLSVFYIPAGSETSHKNTG